MFDLKSAKKAIVLTKNKKKSLENISITSPNTIQIQSIITDSGVNLRAFQKSIDLNNPNKSKQLKSYQSITKKKKINLINNSKPKYEKSLVYKNDKENSLKYRDSTGRMFYDANRFNKQEVKDSKESFNCLRQRSNNEVNKMSKTMNISTIKYKKQLIEEKSRLQPQTKRETTNLEDIQKFLNGFSEVSTKRQEKSISSQSTKIHQLEKILYEQRQQKNHLSNKVVELQTKIIQGKMGKEKLIERIQKVEEELQKMQNELQESKNISSLADSHINPPTESFSRKLDIFEQQEQNWILRAKQYKRELQNQKIKRINNEKEAEIKIENSIIERQIEIDKLKKLIENCEMIVNTKSREIKEKDDLIDKLITRKKYDKE